MSTDAIPGLAHSRAVAPAHASRLVNHGPTVLVSASHAGRRNLMAAAWSMPVEFVPPRIAVVLDKSTWTRELAMASGALALSIPCREQADLCFTVGSTRGRELHEAGHDKWSDYGIEAVDSPQLGLPWIGGCVAWMECRLMREPHCEQAYDTFFVEVVSAFADERVFNGGRWSLREDNMPLHTIHHLGAGAFAVAGPVVQARVLPVIAR